MPSHVSSSEQPGFAASGWLMLIVATLMLIAVPVLALTGAKAASGAAVGVLIVAALVMLVAFLLSLSGFFTLQPNESAVLLLFGAYRGTIRSSGFFWTNPFVKRIKMSLRVRNFNCEKLKVNDKRGNPIEIAAVIVWRVNDTAQAVFDVDHYESYVTVQSETALRHVAGSFAYDDGEHNEVTLRGGGEDVIQTLKRELQERLQRAGVVVEETRLTHLAYSPEIAQAMLRRQQAEAVIAARQKIVQGAVSMVDMALNELSAKKVVELDEERKAAMVSNLLVVLCGETEAQPVINTGTLYR